MRRISGKKVNNPGLAIQHFTQLPPLHSCLIQEMYFLNHIPHPILQKDGLSSSGSL